MYKQQEKNCNKNLNQKSASIYPIVPIHCFHFFDLLLYFLDISFDQVDLALQEGAEVRFHRRRDVAHQNLHKIPRGVKSQDCTKNNIVSVTKDIELRSLK